MATKVLILKPGECAVIPKSAKINSMIVDGDGQATSTCGNLPTPSQYACWEFRWEGDDSGALQDAIFEHLKVGDNIYLVPEAYNPYNNRFLPFPGPAEPIRLAQWIEGNPDFQGLVKLGCSTFTGSGAYLIKIKIPEGLPAPEFKIVNPAADWNNTLYLKASPDSDGDCSTC